MIASPFTSLFLAAVTLNLCSANRKGDHVFYDTELISLIDPQKHGFDIILTEAAHQYLLVNPFQLPAIYVSAIPLNDEPALRQILFKDNVVNKIVKVTDLKEKTWYYLCMEYETFSIGKGLNETTGTQCRIHRTLDKFGKTTPSTVTDVTLVDVGSDSMTFQVRTDANFPLRLTFYLEEGSAPAQILVVHSAKSLNLNFKGLEPAFTYGRLCVLEEPLLQTYTAMGRTVQTRTKHCYLDKSLKTKQAVFDMQSSAPYMIASKERRSNAASRSQFRSQLCQPGLLFWSLAFSFASYSSASRLSWLISQDSVGFNVRIMRPMS